MFESINLYDPNIANNGKTITATIIFFLYYCLSFFNFKPIKIDKTPIGINNSIIHIYLVIPSAEKTSGSPNIDIITNETNGEISVSKNNISPKNSSFFIFSLSM